MWNSLQDYPYVELSPSSLVSSNTTVGNHVTIDVCLNPLWGAAILICFASQTTGFAFYEIGKHFLED